ncbi:hypothetical protein Tco_0663240 [Tanacetum coccineum]
MHPCIEGKEEYGDPRTKCGNHDTKGAEYETQPLKLGHITHDVAPKCAVLLSSLTTSCSFKLFASNHASKLIPTSSPTSDHSLGKGLLCSFYVFIPSKSALIASKLNCAFKILDRSSRRHSHLCCCDGPVSGAVTGIGTQDKDFKVGDNVLLFNSRLRMHPGKLKSKWYGPNVVKTVYPYGTIEITDKNKISFKINGKMLKKC